MVRVVAGGVEHGPAVLGAIWPTLVLPIATITGMTPDTLRAILVHELAHIRRHDYLVNILQMFIECAPVLQPGRLGGLEGKSAWSVRRAAMRWRFD